MPGVHGTRRWCPAHRARRRALPVLLAGPVLALGVDVAAFAAGGRPVLAGMLEQQVGAAQPRPTAHAGADVASSSSTLSSTARPLQEGTGSATYVLPPRPTTSGSHELSFPGLAPGRYAVRYSLVTRGSATVDNLVCYLREHDGPDVTGLGWGTVRPLGDAVATGTGRVRAAAGPPTLRCTSSVPFAISPSGRSTVTFVRD
jgi:hypothetical protein